MSDSIEQMRIAIATMDVGGPQVVAPPQREQPHLPYIYGPDPFERPSTLFSDPRRFDFVPEPFIQPPQPDYSPHNLDMASQPTNAPQGVDRNVPPELPQMQPTLELTDEPEGKYAVVNFPTLLAQYRAKGGRFSILPSNESPEAQHIRTQLEQLVGNVIAQDLRFAGADNMSELLSPAGRVYLEHIMIALCKYDISDRDASRARLMADSNMLTMVPGFIREAQRAQTKTTVGQRWLQRYIDRVQTGGINYLFDKWGGALANKNYFLSDDGQYFNINQPIQPNSNVLLRIPNGRLNAQQAFDLDNNKTIADIATLGGQFDSPYSPMLGVEAEVNGKATWESAEIDIVASTAPGAGITVHDAENAFMGIVVGDTTNEVKEVGRQAKRYLTQRPTTVMQGVAQFGAFERKVWPRLKGAKTKKVDGAFIKVLNAKAHSDHRSVVGVVRGSVNAFVCLPDQTVFLLANQPGKRRDGSMGQNLRIIEEEVPVGSTVVFAPHDVSLPDVAGILLNAADINDAVEVLATRWHTGKAAAMQIH